MAPPSARRSNAAADGPFLAAHIAIAVQQNGAEPSEEAATAIVSTYTSPGLHQSVLRQIFRQGVVSAQGHSLPKQPRFVRPAYLAERFGVAGLRALQQVRRVCLIGFNEYGRHGEHDVILTESAFYSITLKRVLAGRRFCRRS